MQPNQAVGASAPCVELIRSEAVRELQFVSVDGGMVERGAQALFEFVFSATERLDGRHVWANCDAVTKEGFRLEAAKVLEAALRLEDE